MPKDAVSAGTKTGGKGSFRRPQKRVAQSSAAEGEKVWQAALRQGCRNLGDVDSITMILDGQTDALSFKKAELAMDMKANTYVIKGTPEKKPLADVVQDMFANIDMSKFKKDKDENDLGDDIENVDFANPDAAAPPPTNEAAAEEPKEDLNQVD
jgi:nascent polypeptide-associated complex subunit beta